jgi:hypothetical protein
MIASTRWRSQFGKARGGSILAGRADQRQGQAGGGEELLGALPGQALIGNDGGARSWPVSQLVFQHRAGLLAFADQFQGWPG